MLFKTSVNASTVQLKTTSQESAENYCQQRRASTAIPCGENNRWKEENKWKLGPPPQRCESFARCPSEHSYTTRYRITRKR
jgi:hypothetical protein